MRSSTHDDNFSNESRVAFPSFAEETFSSQRTAWNRAPTQCVSAKHSTENVNKVWASCESSAQSSTGRRILEPKHMVSWRFYEWSWWIGIRWGRKGKKSLTLTWNVLCLVVLLFRVEHIALFHHKWSNSRHETTKLHEWRKAFFSSRKKSTVCKLEYYSHVVSLVIFTFDHRKACSRVVARSNHNLNACKYSQIYTVCTIRSTIWIIHAHVLFFSFSITRLNDFPIHFSLTATARFDFISLLYITRTLLILYHHQLSWVSLHNMTADRASLWFYHFNFLLVILRNFPMSLIAELFVIFIATTAWLSFSHVIIFLGTSFPPRALAYRRTFNVWWAETERHIQNLKIDREEQRFMKD